MQYKYELDNNDLIQIVLKLSYMSLSNIKWSCMFSGCGVLHILTEKEAKKLTNLSLNQEEDSVKDLFENLALLKCIYKKGSTAFSKPPEEVINPGKYMWNFSSFNKTIEPSTQAEVILSFCRAAETIYNDQRCLGTLMVKNAVVYYDFITTFMRDDNGFFISIEDKTKHLNDDFKIKQISKKINLTDQLLVYEALLQLYHTTSKHEFREYYTSDCSKYLSEARNIFSFITDNYSSLALQSSKNISTCISSLSRCCHMENDEKMAAAYRQIITMLCAEIETRIKITGEVERGCESLSTASPGTHFRTAAALLEGYFETGIEKFKDISLKIYDNVMDLFEPSLGIFSLRDSTKLSYNLRDITDTLKSLFLLYLVNRNEKISDIISSFYTSCFKKNGVVKCIPERTVSILNHEITIDDGFPSVSELQKAPVFMKNIKIDLKKVPTINSSKHFNSFYALYTSSTVLFYLTPLINCNQV